MTCPLDQCDGSGWMPITVLQTRERGREYNYTTHELVQPEQVERLERIIDPARQVLYDAVRRCGCRPQASKPEEKQESRRRK